MILITEFMDDGAVADLSAQFDVTYAPDLADRQQDIPALMPGKRALIVRNRTRVTADLLSGSDDLCVVGRLGVGLDNIDQAACKDRRVAVIPATGANTVSVAEYVVTNALILLRNAYQAQDRMLAGAWPRTDCAGREVGGKLLGLIGFGEIAQETARLAVGLGMQVCAHDPFVPPASPAWQQAQPVSLETLLETADVVSLHVPLLDTTRHMINADTLGRMKAGSVLINAARGGVVDETALVQALRADGGIAGAALDVFETEPLDRQAAEKFAGLGNLVLTPHIAGVTEESNARVSRLIAQKVAEKLTSDS
ncbi:MAG: hydroxyacid dehydrogenase [Rhodobacter sp.]|nr:hydroxyacid dehydrogenase [Rhodobacter sp.]